MNRGINNIHITLTISKLKQQIATLQNQIAQQQAAYVNKQPGGNHNMGGNGKFGNYSKHSRDFCHQFHLYYGFDLMTTIFFLLNVLDFVPVKNPNAPGIGIANIGNVNAGPSANDYLRSQHDSINTLQGTFSEMALTKVCHSGCFTDLEKLNNFFAF